MYRLWWISGGPGQPNAMMDPRLAVTQRDRLMVVAKTGYHARILARFDIWATSLETPVGILEWYRFKHGLGTKTAPYRFWDGCDAQLSLGLWNQATTLSIRSRMRKHLIAKHAKTEESFNELIESLDGDLRRLDKRVDKHVRRLALARSRRAMRRHP